MTEPSASAWRVTAAFLAGAVSDAAAALEYAVVSCTDPGGAVEAPPLFPT